MRDTWGQRAPADDQLQDIPRPSQQGHCQTAVQAPCAHLVHLQTGPERLGGGHRRRAPGRLPQKSPQACGPLT